MSFDWLYHSIASRRCKRARKSDRRQRLALEALEDRLLMAVDFQWVNRGIVGPVTGDPDCDISPNFPFPIICEDPGLIFGDDVADGFNNRFDVSQVEVARQVVQFALDAWEQTIIDVDGDLSTDDVFEVTVSIEESGSDCGAEAVGQLVDRDQWYALAPIPQFPFTPHYGAITIAACDGQWFVDPSPWESSEFLGGIVNPFVGVDPGGPNMFDLFSVVTIEMAHVLGIFGNPALWWMFDAPSNGSYTSDSDINYSGDLWKFDDGGVQALFTTNNGGSGGFDTGSPVHVAEPANQSAGLFGVRDVGNAEMKPDMRYFPSLLMSSVLAETYDDYEIFANHDQYPNFHIQLTRPIDPSLPGELWIRGGSPGDGPVYGIDTGLSNDQITLTSDGTLLNVTVDLGKQVNGTLVNFPLTRSIALADISAIRVFGFDNYCGGTYCDLDGDMIADNDGDDQITLDFSTANWIPPGGIVVDGGSGVNTLTINGPDFGTSYVLTDTQLSIAPAFGAIQYAGFASLTITCGLSTESNTIDVLGTDGITDLVLETSDGPDMVTITNTGIALQTLDISTSGEADTVIVEAIGVAASVFINSGTEDDTVFLGLTSQTLDGILGSFDIVGFGGRDILYLNDVNDADDNNYEFSTSGAIKGRFVRNGTPEIVYDSEDVVLAGGHGSDDVFVRATPTTISLTSLSIFTNAGDDEILIDSNGLGVNGHANLMDSQLFVDAGDGTTIGVDELTVNDFDDATGDTITVTDTKVLGMFGIDGSLEYYGLSTLRLNMGRGDEIVGVEGTAEGTETFVFAGFGNDFITVTAPEDSEGGPPPHGEGDGTVDNIKSLLWIDGQDHPQFNNHDTLVVIDTTDDTSDRMTLTEDSIGIAPPSFGGSIPDTFLGATGAGILYADIDDLTIRMGKGGNSAFVRSTHPTTNTRLETGQGSDTVLVRDGSHTANLIRSQLTIDGQGAHDEVDVDDSAESAASLVTITPDHVLGNATYFGAGGELAYAALEQLTVQTGSASDDATVTGTSPLTITVLNLGDAVDQVEVSLLAKVNLVRSPLVIDGQSSGADMLVNNKSDANPNQVTISDAIVAGNGTFFGPGGSLTYLNVREFELHTGAAGDSVNVQSTASATEYSIHGEGSFDIFLFDSNGLAPGGDLNAILSPVTISGGGSPSNMLILNDSDDTSGDTVTVTATGSFAGSIGGTPGDTFFGPGAATGLGRVTYESVQLVFLDTGQGDDVIKAAPAPLSPIATAFEFNANSPGFGSSGSGDRLDLNLNLVGVPKITVDEFAGGVLRSSTHGPIRFHNVEFVNQPIGGKYDLELDATVAALGGNDGAPMVIEAYRGQIAPQKTLNLRLNGLPTFSGAEAGVNSLTALGSSDSDHFIVQETSDGFPTLTGVAPMSHLNGPHVPGNVSIHFDGGGPDLGSVIDQASVYLLSGSDVAKFDDMMGAPMSGNINVAGQFTMSYVDITPVDFQGAGGTLTIDAMLLTGMSEMTVLNLGGDRYRVVGDGGFETTTFNGFDDFVIRRPAQVPLRTSLVVNSTADGGDANTGDGMCQTAIGNVECTLRAAIEEANASPVDTIQFQIPNACPTVIRPASALPPITSPVSIDGYTQPGSSANTLPIELGTNAVICIELNGGLIGDGSSGLVFLSNGNHLRGLSITGFGYPDLGAPGSTDTVPVGGIVLLGGNNVIEGNFVGIKPDGTTSDANNFYGMYVSSSDNRIGGPARAARNLISGNQGFGVMLTARALPGTAGFTPVEFNRVQGNLIGTDRSGTSARANTAAGVAIRLFARNNLIGGFHTPNGEVRNIISGNGGPFSPYGDPTGPYQDWPDAPFPLSGGHGNGVMIENLALITPTFPVPNTIQGNYIGTTADGTAPLANKLHGVSLGFTNSVTVGGPHNNLGLCDGPCNLISGNAQHGVAIGSTFPFNMAVQGNFIGTDRTGQLPIGNRSDGVFLFITSGNRIGGGVPEEGNIIAFNRSGVVVKGNPDVPNSAGNTIRLNSIHSNQLLGIDLLRPGVSTESDGPTLNDNKDADTGPNALQNFPVITNGQFGADTFATGTLNSVPRTSFLLDFYASASPDPSGYGEGQRWLGSTSVLTNSLGNASFSLMLPGATLPGEWLSATATRLDTTGQTTETSEFSKVVPLSTGIILVGCTLQIQGTEGLDRISLVRVGGEIRATANFSVSPNASVSFDASRIDTVEVIARGGNDSIDFDMSYPASPAPPVPPCSDRIRMRVDAGTGNDASTVHITGGGQSSAAVDVALDGGPGNDTLRVQATDIVLSNSLLDLFGNDGLDLIDATLDGVAFDQFAQKVRGGGEADTIDVTWKNSHVLQKVQPSATPDLWVDGETGNDSIQVTSQSIEADGDWSWMANGGDGGDQISVSRLNEHNLGSTTLVIDASAGDDSITYVTRNLQAIGDMTDHMRGGTGNDRISMSRRHFEGQGRFSVRIEGYEGDDFIEDVSDRSVVQGTDEHAIDGGLGNDQIVIESTRSTAETLVLDVTGGDGKDAIRVVSSSPQVLGGGSVRIDGQAGDDTINANLSNLLLTKGTLRVDVAGASGSDAVVVFVQLRSTSVGVVDARVAGQDGDDSLQLSLIVPVSVLLIPPAELDGGDGFDKCVTTSNVTVVNCEG